MNYPESNLRNDKAAEQRKSGSLSVVSDDASLSVAKTTTAPGPGMPQTAKASMEQMHTATGTAPGPTSLSAEEVSSKDPVSPPTESASKRQKLGGTSRQEVAKQPSSGSQATRSGRAGATDKRRKTKYDAKSVTDLRPGPTDARSPAVDMSAQTRSSAAGSIDVSGNLRKNLSAIDLSEASMSPQSEVYNAQPLDVFIHTENPLHKVYMKLYTEVFQASKDIQIEHTVIFVDIHKWAKNAHFPQDLVFQVHETCSNFRLSLIRVFKKIHNELSHVSENPRDQLDKVLPNIESEVFDVFEFIQTRASDISRSFSTEVTKARIPGRGDLQDIISEIDISNKNCRARINRAFADIRDLSLSVPEKALTHAARAPSGVRPVLPRPTTEPQVVAPRPSPEGSTNKGRKPQEVPKEVLAGDRDAPEEVPARGHALRVDTQTHACVVPGKAEARSSIVPIAPTARTAPVAHAKLADVFEKDRRALADDESQ